MSDVTIAGFSEMHRNGDGRPNEDVFVIPEGGRFGFIGDGVSRHHGADGSYPDDISTRATEAVRSTVEEYSLMMCRGEKIICPDQLILGAFRLASIAVRRANEELGFFETADFDKIDYLGITAVGFSVARGQGVREAAVASIGDPVALLVERLEGVRLLSRDQLEGCHQFSFPYFKALAEYCGLTREAGNNLRRVWQRSRIRNNRDARDPSGHRIGFGVLTGEERALDFVELHRFAVAPEDRIVIASDSLRVLQANPWHAEPSDYAPVNLIAREGTPREAAARIIALIREREERRATGSDDATVIVAEIH